jgi:hypothetical protein
LAYYSVSACDAALASEVMVFEQATDCFAQSARLEVAPAHGAIYDLIKVLRFMLDRACQALPRACANCYRADCEGKKMIDEPPFVRFGRSIVDLRHLPERGQHAQAALISRYETHPLELDALFSSGSRQNRANILLGQPIWKQGRKPE